jgi:cytochrome c556
VAASIAFARKLLRSGFGALRTLGCLALIAGLVAAFGRVALCQEQSAAMVKDEIFARKILMGTIDNHMDEIDWMLTSGKAVDLPAANDHADTMSVMLQAFPYLFPPKTDQWRPDGKRDPARDTFASPDVWKNFSDFYQQAAAASKLAYAASRARNEGDLRKAMASLRTACDSCHALYLKGDREQ